MRLLITGGLGFIGSNLVRYLLKTHPTYEIINLDAETYAGHRENLADVDSNPKYKLVVGRVEVEKLVDELVSGKMFGPIDGIINLAAESHVDRSISDPFVFVKSNIMGTQVLLDAAFKYGLKAGAANLTNRKTTKFAMYRFPPMKSTAPWDRKDSSRKKPRSSPTAPTRPAKPALICSAALISTPTACPR